VADDDVNETQSVGLKLDLSNVITFPSLKELRKTGGPVTRVRQPPEECLHGTHGVFVNEKTRTVECKRCGKAVDAFDALLSLSMYWDWANTRAAKKAAHAECEKIKVDLDKLRALRRKENDAVTITAKKLRKAFRDQKKKLELRAAGCKSRGDKTGERKFVMVERHLGYVGQLLLDGVVGDDEAADEP